MIVQIQKVEDASKGDNHWKVITYEKDGETKQKAIFLKDKYDLLVEDATIDLVMKKNESNPKYWDVVDIKPATLGEAVKKEETSQYAFKYHEQMQMNRRTALMQACLVWKDSQDSYLILTKSEDLINWLEKGEIPEKETQVQTQPAIEHKQVADVHKTDTIENLGQLFLYLTKTFKILPTRVLKIYSCKDNESLQKYLTDNKISYQDVIEQVKQLKESAK